MENQENKTSQVRGNQNMQGSTQANTSTSGKSSQAGTTGKGGLNNITGMLQQFGSNTMNKVSGMSTTQKVVGGSLLALGAGWIAMNSMNKNKSKLNKTQQKNINKNLGRS